MLQTRGRRAQMQLAKIASIGTITGAATILKEAPQWTLLAYIIPFLAMAFDFLIISESFTLRRMGYFVLNYRGKNAMEQKWEQFIRLNPLRFSTVGNLVITLVSIFGAIALLMLSVSSVSEWYTYYLNVIWIVLVILLFVITVLIELLFK